MAEKLIVTIAMIAQLTAATSDPCVDHKYIYDNGGRSPKCPYQPEECDRYITENWYQVVNYHGSLEMPTSHVDINSCGANYPGWLNGTHPSINDGTVYRVVCVSGYNDPCRKQVTIRVKNCGHYYVYYLMKMHGCSERYCFGIYGICSPSTLTEATREQGETTSPEHENGKANHTCVDSPVPSEANFQKGFVVETDTNSHVHDVV
ncbi:oncoprotein-induced transcript 3 protein-like [Haliotis rubra]|uniref:oncoprotein-induced transcript 3 protein-like n=1 Tax=Haliotis rubra TaxID=36100 RepID=UPI001EE53E58|nr:oncoprotein-induced transcript 3 protein-like [Haliotis rubra]